MVFKPFQTQTTPFCVLKHYKLRQLAPLSTLVFSFSSETVVLQLLFSLSERVVV